MFLVPLTLPGTKGSLWHGTAGRNKTYLCFTTLQPEHIFNVQGQAGSTLTQTAFTEVSVALNTCEGSSCGLVSFSRILGPQQTMYSNVH